MLPHRSAERPRADLQNKPRLLQERDELHRRYETELRALPANQRLYTNDLARATVDLRLVVQDELLPVNRTAQLVLEGELLRHAGGHLLGIEEHPLALGLGFLKCRFGISQQCVAILGISREQGNSHTGSNAQLARANIE